ncbi:MAG: TIR domain-containing protein [Allosphingosinicella sp.]|uniref:TIR domain-containing protein n=1 Tax=Allosphingosinicella sp. TaxID=2823234 RepID=UPI00395FF344
MSGGGEDRERGRYRAFLSYSHRDAAAARRLHRRLENYRIPRRLVGRDGRGGPVPERLAPIFRDREEFPAAADLSASVREALAVSDCLVVLCSPDAAGSIWVGREIETYRALHPDRPVLAAILRGDPADCFPEALRTGPAGTAIEPLATDLRPEGDGPRLGLLKLVAGIAGVELDALVQRDAQRRLRRVTAVTLAAVTAMLAMVALTLVALAARVEAERQRAEAEGLIEFMLTDLRQRLKSVGRLDVLTAVNQRALGFYEGQEELGRLTDDSLDRRARILHAMGEDDATRGDLDAALASFQEAHRTTAALLARAPEDPARIYAHAQSEYWVGYVDYERQSWPAVRESWGRYKQLSDRLAAADPDNPEWLREAGYAEGNLCTLELTAKGDASAALRYCQAALARMAQVRSLLPADRKAQQDVANRHAWMADAWLANGDVEAAYRSRRTQMGLVRELVDRHPQDMHLKDQWTRTLMTVAELLERLGRAGEAGAYRDQARMLAVQLRTHDPENELWRRWAQRIEGTKEE